MASLREHPPETVFKAQELYCVARLTYREVAAETGVAESSLKRWAAKYGWSEKRAAMAQAECDIRADLVLARSAMLKELIESKNAQVGFAVSSLESLALKQAEAERAGRMIKARQSAEGNRRSITTKEDAAQALQEAVETKLAAMLADPDQVDLAAVKNIKNALELIASIRPQTGDDHRGAQDKGISDDAAQQIIDKILGR